MVKRKTGFKSEKQKRKSDAVSQGQQKRWGNWDERVVFKDHSYAKKAVPDVSHIVHEEVVTEDGVNLTEDIDKWRVGRRIIELGVLADGLSACQQCGLPLSLSNCIDINTFGIASTLRILCINTACQQVNILPTGKKHGHVWDVNTKLAAAMIHTGLGEQQVNGILGQLNIPIISHATLDARQKEIGEVIEDIAEESMKEWREKEVEMTKQLDGNDNITVSVDAGWQKRGSGRTYDSLTGHCSMIGIKTGKPLDFQVRSTTCRVCTPAKKRGAVPKDHDCRKNFEGSAKNMEPEMVVDMVAKARKQGINIDTIVGDGDTTTIARLRSRVDRSIKKRSDRNHVRKLFGNASYSLKKNHPSLSTKVISYLQKCFNYMVAQGKGNAEKIKESLPSLAKHPFGEHSNCDKEWCRFKENSSGLKYKSLPYGKPLSDRSLQTALEAILNTFAKNAEKLAYLESTLSNESFNKSVASKAPKSRHYGGSSSLNYRIAATAAKKNKGHKYLIDVNAKAGLSPGVYTKRLCLLRDMAARKRKAVAMTRQAKLRRIKLKSIRHQKTSSSELREGTCYETGTEVTECHRNSCTQATNNRA